MQLIFSKSVMVSNQCLFACLFVCLFVSDDEDDKKLTKTGVILLALGLCVLAVLLVIAVVACRLHKKSRQRKLYVEV